MPYDLHQRPLATVGSSALEVVGCGPLADCHTRWESLAGREARNGQRVPSQSPYPLRGRCRCCEWWCPRRDHRRGDSPGLCRRVEFANNHAMLRAWAIEGTGGHGAGLSRHLLEMSELVIESDRPKRAARRNGAKSDPLDAIRAAREAMARPRWGAPRTGEERQALSVLLAGSTATATANSTTHCTPWSRPRSSTSQPPATTSPAAPPKARPAERSNAALPATSPATSTAYSKTRPQLLDEA